MIYLTPKYELVYKISDTTILISNLYEHSLYNSEALKDYPGLTQIKDIFIDGLIKLEYKGFKISIFPSQLNFNFSDKNIKLKVCSFTHLEKLISDMKYKNPAFRTNSQKEFSPLIYPEQISNFLFKNEEIIVEEKNVILDYYTEYQNYLNLYNKFNIDIYSSSAKIKFLSLNFQKYFAKNIPKFDEEKEIQIFKSMTRFNLYSEFSDFLIEGEEKFYAICGPTGIGKSFTSLILQKHIFKDYKSLYINLSNNEEINQLKITIIKEIYFLKLNEKEFNSLIEKILTSNYKEIWGIIKEIDDFCSNNKLDFLLILDQYQKDKDINGNLFNLKVKKIFLLSSINDEEVKDALALQIQKKDVKIKYKYILNLDFEVSYIEHYTKCMDKAIKECLKQFDFIPISFFLIENSFKWDVLNFLNFQFLSILRNLKKFFDKFNIDYIEKLHNENKINEQSNLSVIFNRITIDDFLNNIKNIPLEYISYKIIDDSFVELYYAFKYVKNVLQSEIFYRGGRNALLSIKEKGFVKGEKFKIIIFHKLIIDKSIFNIDNFITVDKITNMKLVEEYQNININGLLDKNCILITQKNFFDKEYDFGVLYPKEKELILIQAKYKIDNSNVNSKAYYSDYSKINIITEAVNKNLKINLKKIYILYLSTVEYNNRNSFEILNNKEINCLFYNITNDYFTSNYMNKIFNFTPSESCEIYPNSEQFLPQNNIQIDRINELVNSMGSLIDEEKSINIDNQDNSDMYYKFIDYLKQKQVKNDLINHLGEFITNIFNNYFIRRIIMDKKKYLLFFKVKEEKEIDFDNDMILVYEIKDKTIYYDIQKNVELKDFSILTKKKFKEYYYIIGKWIDDKIINLEEKEN